MRKFLYKPVLQAIDKRESLIAEKLINAERKKSDADKLSDDLQNKIKDFDDQRITRINEIKISAQTEHDRLLAEARSAAKASSEKWHKNLNEEATQLQETIINEIQTEVFSFTKKTLRDLANIELETQIIEVFIKKLARVSDEEKEQWKSILKTTSRNVILRSAFELSATQLDTIYQAIVHCLGIEIQIQHVTEARLISGIEVNINGQKFAWSIENYLTSIENNVHKLLQKKNTEVSAP